MSGLTYCFAIGPGELAYQAKYLLQSIELNTTASREQIVVYVVTEEKPLIDDEILEYVAENATVIEGDMPNKEYPLSAAHAALVEGANHSEDDHLLLLDTDTVVLEDISVHLGGTSDLYLVPAHKSTFYWADLDRSKQDWKNLFEEYGFEFPTQRVTSTTDGGTMLPYFNGGMILTKNNDFPERWMTLCDKLHGKLPEANYFTEMVGLALLASDFEINVLSHEYNYMSNLHKSVPENVKILHYYDTLGLLRAFRNPRVGKKLSQTDVPERYRQMNSLVREYEIFLGYCSATEFHREGSLDQILWIYYQTHKRIKRDVSQFLDLIGLKEISKRLLRRAQGKDD